MRAGRIEIFPLLYTRGLQKSEISKQLNATRMTVHIEE